MNIRHFKHLISDHENCKFTVYSKIQHVLRIFLPLVFSLTRSLSVFISLLRSLSIFFCLNPCVPSGYLPLSILLAIPSVWMDAPTRNLKWNLINILNKSSRTSPSLNTYAHATFIVICAVEKLICAYRWNLKAKIAKYTFRHSLRGFWWDESFVFYGIIHFTNESRRFVNRLKRQNGFILIWVFVFMSLYFVIILASKWYSDESQNEPYFAFS